MKRIATSELYVGSLCLVLALAVLIVLALASPVNRDEDHYIAPATVDPARVLYADFSHGQPPLQPYLLRAVTALFPSLDFASLRVVIAILAAVALILVYQVQRRLGVSWRVSLAVTALMGSTYAFQFAGTVVRNDMLSTVLLTGGMLAAIKGVEGDEPRRHAGMRWCIVGVLFGLAASTKLSFAVPAVAVALFVLVQTVRQRLPLMALGALAVGGIAGGLPMLYGFLAAPDSFLFNTITYHSDYAAVWHIAQGRGWMFSPMANVAITIGGLAVGPGLFVIGYLLWQLRHRPPPTRHRSPAALSFLNTLCVAGFVAACLPSPTSFQHVLPMLPPLFVRFGLGVHRRFATGASVSRWFQGALLVGVAIGFLHSIIVAGFDGRRTGPWSALDVAEEARWIAAWAHAEGVTGTVATCQPRVLLGTGLHLDPWFTSGVFIFRVGPDLPPDAVERFRYFTYANFSTVLDRTMPAALITGDSGCDPPIEVYAVGRNFTSELSPGGHYRIWLPPQDGE